MRGIGPKVVELLDKTGIKTPEQLKAIGAMEAYLQILEKTDYKPHIGLLFALVGAVEDRDWKEVAQNDKARLEAEIEGLREMGIIAND